MTKALMLNSPASNSWVNGDYTNFFGQGTRTTNETLVASATEGATFSRLRAGIISGNSGTGTWRFRDTGADGNNVASGSGAGVFEDTTHSDTLTAGDTFSVSYVDTGSNSAMAWLAANVEFASGYGAFHAGSCGGIVDDRPSETRFHPLAGELLADGEATETDVAFKARGYTTFEALQVRVTANARTNDSTFRNRINGGNGTGVCTFASGATGLVVDDALADAIGDGQTICSSITLGTGLEDLTVTFVGATLKSTNTKQDIFGRNAGTTRSASSTANYFCIGGAITSLTAMTEAQARIAPRFAGTASNIRCYLTANTYASNGTLKLIKSGTEAITLTLTAGGGAGWYENTSDTVTFDEFDTLSFELDEGGASGSITMQQWGLTLAPTVSGGDAPIIHRFNPNLRGNFDPHMRGNFQ